ncbi:L-fucose:H+ symporter permease [Olivibacter sp. SDN3]|uniref:L-fucose:H+ symporter permease n=1 Tax=Olivibacter sp. SDN3 TaxID=2764720 RepID=UPI001651300A|nr:L-fucose:H+ symporter permease [Olivibacter sp. SDN3]QNL50585.1 L-fucose:H+ symporter permease [Olivibacter sp. SDN3]
MSKKSTLIPVILVTSLFFLWALLHNLNPILIPHLRKAFSLDDFQSSLIDTSAYISYFVVAIPAGLYMQRYGYKRGILLGLILYALGALLVIPAASERSYVFFLAAIFVIAAGATFLETVANPYISILGDKENATQRLNFAQSFNGLGAVVAPILGGKFILSGIEHSPDELAAMGDTALNNYLQSEADTVKIPYLVITAVVLLLLLLFIFTRLPEGNDDDEGVNDAHTVGVNFSFKVFKYSHFTWAVISQFFYVGAQVGVGSFFIRYANYVANMGEKNAAYLFGSVAMVGFMLGRFSGTFLMKYVKPASLLAVYGLLCVLLCLLAVVSSGDVALYALVAVPFFMSIMYPTIFSLGIKGLSNEETKIASSFLVMAIIGGAIIPVLMGLVSVAVQSIQIAYIVPLLCFLVVLYYGVKGYKLKI